MLEQNYERLLTLVGQLEQGLAAPDGAASLPAYLAALKEIREHVKTSMQVAQLLVDVRAIERFQRSVLEAINEADPATQQRVVAKLREARARSLVVSEEPMQTAMDLLDAPVAAPEEPPVPPPDR